MTCKTMQQTLLSMEDPGQPSASIKAHLGECAACREWYRRLLRIEHHAQHLPAPPAREKEAFLRLLQETPAIEKRWSVRHIWQGHAPRGTGIALAASLLLAVSWWFWPTPKGNLANSQASSARDPLLSKLLESDLVLARTNSPRERVETLAKLANDLCEETQSVALEAQASPDVLRTMAELYKQVIVDGIVKQAKNLHGDERKLVLAPIAEQLNQAGSKLQVLADQADIPARLRLGDFVAAAREGRKQLRSLP